MTIRLTKAIKLDGTDRAVGSTHAFGREREERLLAEGVAQRVQHELRGVKPNARARNTFVLFGDSITEMHKGFTTLTVPSEISRSGAVATIARGTSSALSPRQPIRVYKTRAKGWAGTKQLENMQSGSAEFYFNDLGVDPEPTPYAPHTQAAFFVPQWNTDRGWFWWANAMSGWRAEVLNVSGVGGDRSYNLLQRIADIEMGVLPYEPAYCTVMIGVNDLNGDLTSAQVIANLEQIYRILLDANIGVVAMTVLPVTTGHFKAGNETHSQAIMAVNEWIRRTATRTPGMYLCDSCAAVVDPTAATFTTLSGMLASDGIHLTAKGARAVGAELAKQLQWICPPNGSLVSSNRDSYGASSTNSQLIDNPLFTGSGGSAGTGMSGTIAASWQVERLGGTPTGVCSVVARTVVDDGDAIGNNQRVVITAGANNDLVAVRQSTNLISRVSEGDLVVFQCAVKLSSCSNVKSLRVLVQSSDGSLFPAGEALKNSDTTFDQADFAGVFKTPPFRIPPGMTSMTPRVYVTFSGSGGATLDVGRASLIKADWREIY